MIIINKDHLFIRYLNLVQRNYLITANNNKYVMMISIK
jgi:hypothetical protein